MTEDDDSLEANGCGDAADLAEMSGEVPVEAAGTESSECSVSLILPEAWVHTGAPLREISSADVNRGDCPKLPSLASDVFTSFSVRVIRAGEVIRSLAAVLTFGVAAVRGVTPVWDPALDTRVRAE